jgi:hypothetical protein
MVASKAAFRFQAGQNMDSAIQSALLKSAEHFESSSCGVIAIDSQGRVSLQTNSRVFAVACAGSSVQKQVGVIRSTVPILRQLQCHESPSMVVGVSKYPTMPKQLTVQFKSPQPLARLDLYSFQDHFRELQLVSRALRLHTGSSRTGLVMSGAYEAHIFAFDVDDCKSNRNFPGDIMEPTWTQISSDSESYDSDSDMLYSESLSSEEEANFLTTRKFGNMLKARIRNVQVLNAEDTIADLFVQSLEHGDFLDLPETKFKSLTTQIWKALRFLSNKFELDLAHLRLKICPSGEEGSIGSIFFSKSCSGVPLEDPRPGTFRSSFDGDLETALGLRSTNLDELPAIACAIKDNFSNILNY